MLVACLAMPKHHFWRSNAPWHTGKWPIYSGPPPRPHFPGTNPGSRNHRNPASKNMLILNSILLADVPRLELTTLTPPLAGRMPGRHQLNFEQLAPTLVTCLWSPVMQENHSFVNSPLVTYINVKGVVPVLHIKKAVLSDFRAFGFTVFSPLTSPETVRYCSKRLYMMRMDYARL